MRILLLGATGQVGHELRRRLPELGEVICATRDGTLDGLAVERADFDQPDSLPGLIERIAPDMVVNAAAYTAVDRAETDVESAFRVNAEAPGLIAQACSERDALLIHYSTDYVFDGLGTRPYAEDDPTAPLSVYGASKLAGERAVGRAGCRHLLFRTGWVYGKQGANFMRTMLRLASERDELRVVADQFGAPTPSTMIADVTVQAVAASRGVSGLFHMTAGGQTSWHGFASAIFESAHRRGLLARIPRVLPIATAEYPTPARRPGYSRLDCRLLQRTFDIRLPEWEQGLERVLGSLPVQAR